jgi:hypothetical protein
MPFEAESVGIRRVHDAAVQRWPPGQGVDIWNRHVRVRDAGTGQEPVIVDVSKSEVVTSTYGSPM